MKKINDYTDEELIELYNNEEEINNVIDYECAIAGVPFLPELPPRPTPLEITSDILMYQVGGFIFDTQEDALKLIDHLKGSTLYESRSLPNASYNQNTVQVTTSGESIDTKKFYSKEYWDGIKDHKKKYDALKEDFDEKKCEYDDISEKRTEIYNKVWDILNEMYRKEGRTKDYIQKYIRYLDLANSDKEIAFKFLSDAHPEVSEIENFKDRVFASVLDTGKEE